MSSSCKWVCKGESMSPTTTNPTESSAVETVTIRMATSADAAALSRLAELDSAPRFKPVPMLVAEVDGELRVAVPLGGGRVIADPFQRTAELVAILAERGRQLGASPARAARRWRPLRALRPASVPRA
jgi:hypothetical protein